MPRIDPAFTDLLAAAVNLLPGVAPFADKDRIAQAVAGARASRDLERWPLECLDLLAACEAFLVGTIDALRNREVGRAAEGRWLPAEAYAWQRRRDAGDGFQDAAE